MCYVIHLVLFLTLVRNEAVTSAAADDKKMGNPLHCDWVPECYCRASGEEYRVDCTDPELEEVPWNLPSNITELYISGTNLELLHEFSFYNYSDLRELDLSANKITEVEQRAFHQQFKLEVLVLRGNPELSVLDPGSFTPLINLHTLELSQCSLTQIPFRMNLPLLERLDMKDNDIEDVPTSTFQTCPSLLDINLENNNINNLGNNAFSGTSSLQRLFLRNNEISDIQQQDFGTLESLEILDISDNSIPQLDNNIFRDLESLNILYLQDNAIASLGSNAFSGLSSLTQLHLDNNALQEVPDIPSDHLPSLRTLKLSGNAIGTIPLNAFKDVGQIVDLSIGRMTSLTFIEDGAFSGMSALSSLDLRGNPNLQNLGVDALPDSEHETLEYIYLQDNAFVYLDERLFQSKDRLTYVDLFNNPFNCSCDLKWMPRVVEDNVPWASHWRSSTTPPRCKTPSHLENARIPDMKETDMTCDAPEVERISPETQTAHLMQNMSFVGVSVNGLPASQWLTPDGEWIRPISHPPLPDMRRYATQTNNSEHAVIATLYIRNTTLQDDGRFLLLSTNIQGNSTVDFRFDVIPYELTTPPEVTTDADGAQGVMRSAFWNIIWQAVLVVTLIFFSSS